MLGEWTGASVEADDGKPEPDVWTPVDVPGRPSAFADADAVAYRTAFDDPRSGDDDRAVLVLRGLYAHARVWLNDELIGTHDAYYRPFRHAFEPAASNELLVECRAPQDRFGGIHDTDAVPDEDAVPGIWWDVALETHPATFISELDARPHVGEDGAAIHVTATVEASDPIDDRITFSLRPEGEFQSRGMMDRASVEADAGERVAVEHTIDVRDPSLWWPRGHGPQHRYSVRAKLDDRTRSVTTGLCSVSLDADGLLVNGERVPGRGVNLVSATTEDIERAVEANATYVRVHAHAPPDAVYEAADEAGLLVWQDLPLTGPGEFSVERGRDVAANVVETYGTHPSLAAFGVHDSPVDLFPDPLGSGLLDRLKLRWRTWRASYDRAAAETIAGDLPDDRPVFPVVGSVGIDPDAAVVYPGWEYGSPADVDWLLDHFGIDDAVAAFGVASLGDRPVEDESGFDRATHDFHVGDADDDRASQRYQTTVLKQVAETLRRRDLALLSASALRDAGDAGMGVLERDGTEKEAFGALRTAYEPVQAMAADPSPGGVADLGVVNDTPDDISGTVEWEAGGENETADVAVDAYDDELIGQIRVPADAETLSLSLSVDDQLITNLYYL